MHKLSNRLNRTVIATVLGLSAVMSHAATETFAIDPTHTATVFTWDHFGFSKPSANFSQIQGNIVVDAAAPAKSSVEVTIPVSSLNTNVKALDDELQKEGWFNAAKYPTITFKSSKVETKDQKNFKITGDLTIKGITKPVVLNATLNKKGIQPFLKVPAIGFNATTTIKRSDFGMGQYAPAISDEMPVVITVEAHGK